MKKILAVGVALVVIFVFLGFLPIHGEAQIYDNVIRLHVLANSDSEEDQALKLKVRDEVLLTVSELCSGTPCADIEQAYDLVNENIAEITAKAEKCIANEGYSYPVEVVLGKENYPTKNYEELAFPAGRYLSLQVKIGDAAGQNWWCVLFPPLCLSAASENGVSAEDALVNIGFSGEQYKIITESDNVTYNVRFKILETIDEVFS